MVDMIIEHTTGVINFNIPNFLIDESDCSKFTLTDRVRDIHSNHMHIGDLKKVVKRRKPKVYKKKRHGDPEAFDSQVQISIRSLNDNDKYYKIKVFRNGSGVVPGVLCQSLTDVKEPLDILGKYLSDIYGREIRCENIRGVTHNYKIRTNIGCINMRKLFKILSNFKIKVYTVSLSIIEQYLSTPLMNGERIVWSNILMSDRPIKLDVAESISYIMSCRLNINKKNDIHGYRLCDISHTNFAALLTSDQLYETYAVALTFIRKLITEYNCSFTSDDVSYYISIAIRRYINSSLLCEPEYFRYYLNDRINKLTANTPCCSIVFYSSGKINLHGISNDESLHKTVNTLNSILELYKNTYGVTRA